MNRREFVAATAGLGLSVTRPSIARGRTREIAVAEPVHGAGYLPLYIGMANGYFAEADVTVTILTIENGSGHINAVLSGQAFAFIGGPEHNAYAKLKGAELRAVVNCVDRGNVYYCAAKGQEPTGTDWARYFKGKRIAIGPFGGTPNSITRYLLKSWKLDPKSDVTLLEVPNSTVPAAVKSGQAQIGASLEPLITQGVRQGFWGEPFYSIPQELGPYAYSTFNVRLSSIQREPELVRAFVRGMLKSLQFLYAKPAASAEIAKRQFPTMALEDLKAALDRSYADALWSRDGTISPQAWTTAKDVVRAAGLLAADVKYEDIIDMSFVNSVTL